MTDRLKELQKEFIELSENKENELFAVYFLKAANKHHIEDFLTLNAFKLYHNHNNKIKNDYETLLFLDRESLKEVLFEKNGIL